MTLKEVLSVPLAPLTIEQFEQVSTTSIHSNFARIMRQGNARCVYIYMLGAYNYMDDDDNKSYEETDEDGDPTDPDDEGHFAMSGYAVVDFGDRTEEFGVNFDLEKLLKIAQPLYNPAKLASYVQRRKA